ncbi:hypothetical protein B4110_3430 [Parageobacillus toebii]|uniref:Uncharacterized protein n=1 Tax=Parageobacillus toebii TaxID=153151 RepID=A0A150MZP0_9BACL|nr:hypothetical protein B4110_3430 [Parageobacillus toebii]
MKCLSLRSHLPAYVCFIVPCLPIKKQARISRLPVFHEIR